MVQVFARQLGTNNESRANFDSRTGTVKGWSQVNHTAQQHENEETNHDEAYVEPAVLKLASLYSQENDLEGIAVVNAIIMRAKRVLLKLNQKSEEYVQILNLIKEYSFLLEFSKDGENNDEQIEVVEEQLLSLLEGK